MSELKDLDTSSYVQVDGSRGPSAKPELKECPFCGCGEEYLFPEDSESGERIFCGHCIAMGPQGLAPGEACCLWNLAPRQADVDTLQAANDKAQDRIDELEELLNAYEHVGWPKKNPDHEALSKRIALLSARVDESARVSGEAMQYIHSLAGRVSDIEDRATVGYDERRAIWSRVEKLERQR